MARLEVPVAVTVPLLRVKVPVMLLAPAKVRVPVPFFTRLRFPEALAKVPWKTELTVPVMVRVAAVPLVLEMMAGVPTGELSVMPMTVSAVPFKLKDAPVVVPVVEPLTCNMVVLGRAFETPAIRLPPDTVVVPV